MATTTAGTTAPDAALGSLRIPPPKHFSGKGKEDDCSEFEQFSRQLKAYLSIQNPRYKVLMDTAEQQSKPVSYTHLTLPTILRV